MLKKPYLISIYIYFSLNIFLLLFLSCGKKCPSWSKHFDILDIVGIDIWHSRHNALTEYLTLGNAFMRL